MSGPNEIAVDVGGEAGAKSRLMMGWPMYVVGALPVLVVGLGAANLASTLSQCGSSDAAAAYSPVEPPLSGVIPGRERPKLLLAQDVDWPPYAFIGMPPDSEFTVAGFGNDFAKGMAPGCGVDVVTMQTDWSKCWDNGKLGVGLETGYYHGCMTYTHTVGVRNRFAEFSHGILKENKPAGLLTRLVNGQPLVDGRSNLKDKKIVDVTGWAPTADTLAIVKNSCTGANFEGFEMLTPPSSETPGPNDVAMEYLMDGRADAIWIYADQAYNYDCTKPGVTPEWDCTKWSGFGTTFAYIHVGMSGHIYNGTTLTLSKKGSGLKEIVDPCIEKFMQTEEYYNICKKHKLEASCYENSFFPTAATTAAVDPWMKKTSELTDACSSGYCPCPAA